MANGSGCSGKISELEKMAMKQCAMPDGLTLNEQSFFQAISYLYARFRAGMITREQGKAEKIKIIKQKNDADKLAERDQRCGDRMRDIWKNVEHTSADYAKSRTLEAADALYAAIYGLAQGKGENHDQV